MKWSKFVQRLAASQTNVRLADLERLLKAMGFRLARVSGSHRIWQHPDIPDAMINLQSDRGQVKPYQVRQFLKLVEHYNLGIDGQA